MNKYFNLILYFFYCNIVNIDCCFPLHFNKCKLNNECCSYYCEIPPYQYLGYCSEPKNGTQDIPITVVTEQPFTTERQFQRYTTERRRIQPVRNLCEPNGYRRCTKNSDCCSNYCFKNPRWKHGDCREEKKVAKNQTTIALPITVTVIPIDTESDQCGTRSVDPIHVKIVGGIDAEDKEIPWIVSIQGQFNSKTNGHFCGGTILNKRYIITAAHCFVNKFINPEWKAEDFYIVAGLTKLNKANKIIHKVEKVIIHDNYDTITHDNDIAILKLSQDLKFSQRVKNICLAPKHFKVRNYVLIAGWGHQKFRVDQISNELKLAFIKVRTKEECEESFKRNKIAFTDNMICAGGEANIDSCQADSGGPLIKESNGNFYLYGVISFGRRCGEYGKYGVYTKVSNYIKWIKDISDK